jgi:hypothetical protein
LWVLFVAGGPRYYIRQPDQSLAPFLAPLTGPHGSRSDADLAALLQEADSLDLVEIVMEIEDGMRQN